MKDFLGNDLNKKDFIVVDSYTSGGRELRLGIVLSIDPAKGKLNYIIRCAYNGNQSYYQKHTTVMERILKVHHDLIPNDIAAGLWSEASKLV